MNCGECKFLKIWINVFKNFIATTKDIQDRFSTLMGVFPISIGYWKKYYFFKFHPWWWYPLIHQSLRNTTTPSPEEKHWQCAPSTLLVSLIIVSVFLSCMTDVIDAGLFFNFLITFIFSDEKTHSVNVNNRMKL